MRKTSEFFLKLGFDFNGFGNDNRFCVKLKGGGLGFCDNLRGFRYDEKEKDLVIEGQGYVERSAFYLNDITKFILAGNLGSKKKSDEEQEVDFTEIKKLWSWARGE